MTRFVLDETSWAALPAAALVEPATEFVSAVERLLDRLGTMREQDHTVGKHSSVYETVVGESAFLVDVIYAPEFAFLGHDLRLRLMVAVDQTPNWDSEFSPAQTGVTINGLVLDAPSIAAAWENTSMGVAVGCVPLDCVGRQGRVHVAIGGETQIVHFVTSDAEQAAFFRDAIELENVDEAGFASLAVAAFPTLGWADRVWAGLSNFSRPFRDVRAEVSQHLAVLSDHAAELFGTLLATHPDQIGPRLTALGAAASDENGATKRHRECERDRTRAYRGTEFTFWWHTKLQPHVDRIHFVYLPASDRSRALVVVGIFTRHCRLPN